MKSDQTNADNSASSCESAGLGGRILAWSALHPVMAIVIVSLLAVIVNCYPVVFCGKSFAASTGVPMVYDGWPPLPQMKAVPQTSNHGSDTGAMLFWEIPMGFIESRSILDHGQLPLWDRYGHAGYTLIGQGETMLGDPLQFIVIFGHGSAWAWDIKFLAAKFLFCVGFGWLILRLFDIPLLAMIYAALGAYCGAFFYINNHPVFFVFCYAPWILLSALELFDLRSKRFLRWGAVWLLANYACFNAGHLEVAVDLIGGLNLMAVAHALLRNQSLADGCRVLARLAIVTLLFLGLSAPVWISFLTTLGNSASAHMRTLVLQLPFQVLLGAFDERFYDVFRTASANPPAPASSLLIFVGCVLSLLRWRQLGKDIFFWINGCAIAILIACIFALVPASVLEMLPYFNRVRHFDTDLSYLLVILVMIQSAYGFKSIIETRNFQNVRSDVLWTALILVGMIVIPLFTGYVSRPIPWVYVCCMGISALCVPLLFAFLKSRGNAISIPGWGAIIILAFIPHFRFGLYNFGNADRLLLPGERSVLDAGSPSIDYVKADTSEPFRIAAMGKNFYGDYSAVYGLEDIRSCAPLSNLEFVNLLHISPGTKYIAPGDWEFELTNVAAAQPLLNLLNVKYLFGSPRMALPGGDFRIVNRGDFGVVENLDVWPRAFFSDKIFSISSDGEFIQKLFQHGQEPFVALAPEEIENHPGLQQLETVSNAVISPATNYSLLPNSTAFDIHAASPGVVCLTECQGRDFSATANGRPLDVLTVNRAFKGVFLDQPGDYHLDFVYRPRYWRISCVLFWTALATAIVLTLVVRCMMRQERRHSQTKS